MTTLPRTRFWKCHYLPTFFILFGLACAPTSNLGLNNENRIFSPNPMLPLKVAITAPLIPATPVRGHQVLEDWNSSPGKRRLLMRCTWQEGLVNLLETMVPATEILFLGEGRNPLAALGPQVSATTDSLGKVRFTLEGKSALALARHRGWTHLVVPQSLNYYLDDQRQDLVLSSAVAIVDVQEQAIVWQGIIDSRQVSASSLGPDRQQIPALTLYEETTYRYILDLMKIFDRQLNQKPQSRHDLASPCQDKAPLLAQE